MKIKKIHVENYKTYKLLDLDLEVTDDRPIILIGGGNGCGKTTLFDAIYHALYGLKIKDARQFEELFNAGVKNEYCLLNKNIILICSECFIDLMYVKMSLIFLSSTNSPLVIVCLLFERLWLKGK